jgi:Ca2+-binding EF-hand superfamily protein
MVDVEVARAKIQEILHDEPHFNELTEKAFHDADTEHTGHVNKDQLKVVIATAAHNRGIPLPDPALVHEIAAKYNIDLTGTVNLVEFKTLVKQVLEGWLAHHTS